MKKNLAVLLVLLAAGCSGGPLMTDENNASTSANPTVKREYAPPMDPKRKISAADCGSAVDTAGGNLMCRPVTEAERRARIAEEERQARARKEAAERAERERLERERAEQAARDEAARKAREAEEARLAAAKAAEEERLAAERRRLEAEAARKAQEERERQEKLEAEARERQRAEQEAREAAERERRRLEEEWLAGRALLEKFVANYGQLDRFRDVAVPINGFLEKTR